MMAEIKNRKFYNGGNQTLWPNTCNTIYKIAL